MNDDVKKLSVIMGQFTDKMITNLAQAQQDTAFDIQNDMFNMAPVDTGVYRESIVVSEPEVLEDKISTKIYSDYKVYTSNGKSYLLGQLLESGTKPHGIDVVKKQVLTDGETFFGRHVNHPGTSPQPHMIPALNKNVRNYKDRIKKAIKEAKI